MRKILAGLMATAMVTSICATASFAAVASSTTTATLPDWTIEPSGSPFTAANTAFALKSGAAQAEWNVKFTVDTLSLDFQNASNASLGVIKIPVNLTVNETADITLSNGSGTANDTATYTAITEITESPSNVDITAKIGEKVGSYTFSSVKINDTYYSGKVAVNATNKKQLDITFNDGQKIEGLDHIVPSWSISDKVITNTILDGTDDATPAWDNAWAVAATGLAVTNIVGTPKETIETEKVGDLENVPVSKVLVAYPDGSPIPLTEKGIGVDANLNDKGGVQSGKTVYFMLRDDEKAAFDRLEDEDYWKMKVNKADNGKYVKAITDVTKIFSGDMYDANNGAIVEGSGKTRHRYIKVELNEIYTDDEYRIGLDLRLNATDKAINSKVATKDSSELKVKDFKFWMKNIVKNADNDWSVGIGGLMLNPVTNDWNNVTYFDEEGDVAFMKFFGDSDTGKFYAKLSTKWAHEDYAAYFNDQDAFYFEFTGSPKLSSTSRADLQIYNPFVDEDGEETIDPSTATVYQVVDGDLIDVTESFTYGEGENGDNAFITRTRFLGSYIICEKPVEEAVGDSDIDDLMPDDLEVPEDVTPDAGNNGGAKQPANTGRYI